MQTLLRFWNEHYGLDRPLETDSRLRGLLNRYVVAALMNRFPRATRRVLAMSRGELARLLFVEGECGSFRVLRAIYEYAEGRNRGDLLNRLLMESPAIKAARNRRVLARRMLETCLLAQAPAVPALVLAVGGGDGSLEAEVLGRLGRRNVYYCAVDKDHRAAEENRRVMEAHGLEGRGFVFARDIVEKTDVEAAVESARRQFNVPFDGIHAAVCHGIAEYLDIGADGNETLARLLDAIHACTVPGGSLAISHTDHHDRERWSEQALAWHMRLRSKEELAAEVEAAGWRISVCQHEPMGLITMCLAVKAEGQRLRIDRQSETSRPLAPATVQTPPRRMRASREQPQ